MTKTLDFSSVFGRLAQTAFFLREKCRSAGTAYFHAENCGSGQTLDFSSVFGRLAQTAFLQNILPRQESLGSFQPREKVYETFCLGKKV